MTEDFKQLLHNYRLKKSGHILYCFNDEKSYIENEANYIISGVRHGAHILVVENDRIFPSVYKKIRKQLNDAEMEKVHHINNFDFYCFEGSFHRCTMAEYFLDSIEGYMKEAVKLQTWGHVEWRTGDQVKKAVGEYEKLIDPIIKEKHLISVCAYNASRLPEDLRQALLKCHSAYMTDGTITHIAN